MFAILALASAACYGAADFLGGLTAKRASTIPVVVVSQLAGLALLFIMLPLVPAASPTRLDYIWGAVAGLAGGVGVALLYRALAIDTKRWPRTQAWLHRCWERPAAKRARAMREGNRAA